MNAKTKTALKKAIKKYRKTVRDLEANLGQSIIWEWPAAAKIAVNNIPIPFGTDDCPLCQLYLDYNRDEENYCKGCCIAEDTARYLCERTPYHKFERLLLWDSARVTKRLINAARAELHYLEDLYKRLTGKEA